MRASRGWFPVSRGLGTVATRSKLVMKIHPSSLFIARPNLPLNLHRFLRVVLLVLVLSSGAALLLMANNAPPARAAIPQRRTNSGSVVSAPNVSEWHVCQSGGANFTTIQA